MSRAGLRAAVLLLIGTACGFDVEPAQEEGPSGAGPSCDPQPPLLRLLVITLRLAACLLGLLSQGLLIHFNDAAARMSKN